MEITWDEPKWVTNKAKHGFDFADLTEEFFAEATIYPAKSGRFIATGWFGDVLVTIVFAYLGTEGLSVISMRPASRKERSDHDET